MLTLFKVLVFLQRPGMREQDSFADVNADIWHIARPFLIDERLAS
jgi:hypothetical protein